MMKVVEGNEHMGAMERLFDSMDEILTGHHGSLTDRPCHLRATRPRYILTISMLWSATLPIETTVYQLSLC